MIPQNAVAYPAVPPSAPNRAPPVPATSHSWRPVDFEHFEGTTTWVQPEMGPNGMWNRVRRQSVEYVRARDIMEVPSTGAILVLERSVLELGPTYEYLEPANVQQHLATGNRGAGDVAAPPPDGARAIQGCVLFMPDVTLVSF